MIHTDTPLPTEPDADADAVRRHRPRRGHDRYARLATVVAVIAFLAAAALVLSVASTPADARFPINNFSNVDDTATVTPSGANVAVSGWIKCTAGEIAEVRVTVTQGDTEAAGKTHVRCGSEIREVFWTIHVTPRGPATFDAGRDVSVDAWAVPRARGQATDDPHVWSRDDVVLVPNRGPGLR